MPGLFAPTRYVLEACLRPPPIARLAHAIGPQRFTLARSGPASAYSFLTA
jgi:hypothetical protein